MSVPGMLLSAAAVLISAVSAGLFLRLEKRTLILSAITAIVSGCAVCWVEPWELNMAAGLIIGLPPAAICVLRAGKLTPAEALLYYLVGAGYYTLCCIFRASLGAVHAMDVPFLIYCAFFYIHLPAVLLSFRPLSLPSEKRAALSKGGASGSGLGFAHLLGVGAALLAVLAAVFPFIPAADIASVIAKILAAVSLFWAGLAVITLLAAYDQKREQSSAEGEYREDMTTFMNVVRSQRHDYNLHVQTVAGLIAQQKWDECRDYVDALVQDTAGLNAILPIREPAIASLIGYYRALAAKRGYTLSIDVRDDMSRVRTNTYETNKIIGNLLQNAFDELEAQGERGDGHIDLAIFKRGEDCLIRVSNSVLDSAAATSSGETMFRQGYTTKDGHEGVGLSSIRALARRVGGEVTAWVEGGTIHFVASIPMDSAERREG